MSYGTQCDFAAPNGMGGPAGTGGPRVVISKVPLRVSFVGGGSDLPGGAGRTISAAIDKFVWVMAKWRYDDRVILNWREKEDVGHSAELQHELAREALQLLGVHKGIEISTFADVPGVGSGLGSSAATTVAILQAVGALRGLFFEPERLARLAVEVELDRLGRKGGSQDQFASALGGVVVLEHDDGRVTSHRHLQGSRTDARLLSLHFPLFSPREARGGSEDVLATFRESDEFRTSCAALVDEFERCLCEGEFGKLGEFLDRHARVKSEAFGGYEPEGDPLKIFRVHQPTPHKLCGAGGGGHLLLHTTLEDRDRVVDLGRQVWGPELPWFVSEFGAQIVHTEHE